MDTIVIALGISYIAIGLLVYKIIRLEARIKTMDKEHRKVVADAGMALTETIKVAFDNLKQINQKHERLSAIVKDNKEKIQNIMVGRRPSGNMGKIDNITRLRAAIADARNPEAQIKEDDNE